MTASINEIDMAMKGAGVRKSVLAKLIGVIPAAITRQVARGHYQTIRIGGVEFVRSDVVRATFGLDRV